MRREIRRFVIISSLRAFVTVAKTHVLFPNREREATEAKYSGSNAPQRLLPDIGENELLATHANTTKKQFIKW